MAERPYVVGLTGSIGMGKSETAKMFAKLGVPVYDADAAVHRLYEPGGAAVPAIAHEFPGCVTGGRVDRAALGKLVTADQDAFRKLEQIVHPLVAREQIRFLDAAAEAGAELVVLDIPLLFETGGEARVDLALTVSAPRAVQIARVLRRGLPHAEIERIIALQMPDAEKRRRADAVIATGLSRHHTVRRVRQLMATHVFRPAPPARRPRRLRQPFSRRRR